MRRTSWSRIPSYRRAWPEVSMVLCSKAKPKKIIPVWDYRTKSSSEECSDESNVRQFAINEKSPSFMVASYPNCNSPAASRPPLRRSAAHLSRPVFSKKKGFPSAPDENPLFYTANWLDTVTAKMPLPDVTCLQCAPLNPLRKIRYPVVACVESVPPPEEILLLQLRQLK